MSGTERTYADGVVATKRGIRAIGEMHARRAKRIGEHAHRRRLMRVDVPASYPRDDGPRGGGQRRCVPDGAPSGVAIDLGSVALGLVEDVDHLFVPEKHLAGMNYGGTVANESDVPSWR